LELAAHAPVDVHVVMGGVPQDPHIFATTIKENLRLARPGASERDLRAAAGRAPTCSQSPVGARPC
jgi:ATP-binding cassette subfamily C protein CydC